MPDDTFTVDHGMTEFLEHTCDALTKLNRPDLSQSVSDAVHAILENSNCKVITTGLGKAGHAAAKAASSFSSLGVPSCYLNPAEASHGDIGIIQKGDVMLVFSTSGKTREIIETMGLSRRLGVSKIISITSHPDSPVRNLSDIVIDMGVIEEAGHLALAPTTSIVVMLVIADMIAVNCARLRGLTIEQFGLRHHSGYLGAKCRGEQP